MAAPEGSAPKNMPMPDFSKIKFLAPRKEIAYRDNEGYKLTIGNLPWGKNAGFTLKRYRLTKDHDLEVVEEKQATGDSITVSNPLPPPGLELIELRRR
jgi:hypothetical protein